MPAEQHPGDVTTDVGEHHGDDDGEHPDPAVVGEDQQRGEGGEHRHPGGEQHGRGDVTEIVDRRLAEPLAQQAPHHAHDHGAAVGAQQPGGAVRPGQPDHRLTADQQGHDRKRVPVFTHPPDDLMGRDGDGHGHQGQPPDRRE